jgi:hypothetical protein
MSKKNSTLESPTLKKIRRQYIDLIDKKARSTINEGFCCRFRKYNSIITDSTILKPQDNNTFKSKEYIQRNWLIPKEKWATYII